MHANEVDMHSLYRTGLPKLVVLELLVEVVVEVGIEMEVSMVADDAELRESDSASDYGC